MEMRTTWNMKEALRRWFCMVLITVATIPASTQAIHAYTIRDGKMFITLDRKIDEKDLKDFVEKYDLGGIGLWQLVKTNKHDSLDKEGWLVVVHNETGFVISKKLESTETFE